MLATTRWCLSLALMVYLASAALGQTSLPPPQKAPALSPPDAKAVAATVNGQDILEMAVFRALVRANPNDRDRARKEILNFLIDNALIDQYLLQRKLTVADKDVDDRLAQIRKEAGKDYEKFLKNLYLTEAELREQLVNALRWDKFVLEQGGDKVMRELFDKNLSMFDGSQVHARHILVNVEGGDQDKAKAKVAGIKKQIQDEVTQELAKVPANADKLTRERERMKAMDKSFTVLAGKFSTCPSKAEGGDLGWFPRVGAMVEPFARAAFALKPFDLSDAVATEFGYHLIMPVDQKPGKEVKFEDVKPFVVEVFAERLREALLAQLRPQAKIAIVQQPAAKK